MKNDDKLERVGSEESQENIQTWIKKTFLECISELKDEIKEADEETVENLSEKLGRTVSSSS